MKFKKWSIWRANLDPVICSEQGKSRPVLIISEDDINSLMNIVNIIPITSRKSERIVYPNEALLPEGKFGLEKESLALCHQIRSIDKRRLSKYITSCEVFEIILAQSLCRSIFLCRSGTLPLAG